MERTYAEMETHSRAENILAEKLSASICVYLRCPLLAQLAATNRESRRRATAIDATQTNHGLQDHTDKNKFLTRMSYPCPSPKSVVKAPCLHLCGSESICGKTFYRYVAWRFASTERNWRGVKTWMPNGFCNAIRSRSRLTRQSARAAMAHSRNLSSSGSRPAR